MALAGQPAALFVVTRYQEGEYYKAHEDFFPGFDGDRLYTVLIYLNDMQPEQDDSTIFERLYFLPDGFTINVVGETGLKAIDNFCTREEASYLIEKTRAEVTKSQVVIDGKAVLASGRTSSHSIVFHHSHQDPRILPVIARGAMLAGLPADHAERIYVSRYDGGEFYHGHYGFSDDFMTSHRLCTMLIYLNSLDEDQGGATCFCDLNIAVQPKLGRAVDQHEPRRKPARWRLVS